MEDEEETSGADATSDEETFFESEDGDERGQDDAERGDDPGDESEETAGDDESDGLDSLFDDPEDGDDEDAEEEEEEPEENSAATKTGLLKRLKTLAARKRTFEEQAQQATQALATAKQDLEAFTGLYPGKKGLSNATFDKRFMDAVEQLRESNPTVKAAVDTVLGHLQGKPAAKLDRDAAEDQKPNPAIERVLERTERAERREAERGVQGLLKRSNVRPELRKAITRDALSRIDFKNGEPSESDISKALRETIRDNGYSKDFLTGRGERRRGPATGGGRNAGTVLSGERAESRREEPKAPKTHTERFQRGRRRLEAALAGARK